jgi:hypothetical protein
MSASPLAHRLGQRAGVLRRVTEIGVEEQQVARRHAAFPAVQEAHRLGARLHRGTLATRPRVTDHGRTRPFGQGSRLVPRSVVDDQDQVHAGQADGRPHGPADPVGLFPGRDDHSGVTAWRHGAILV